METSSRFFLKIKQAVIMVLFFFQGIKGQASCSEKTDRFIKGRCYTFYNESLTWQNAKIRCEERGQVLASVDTMIQIKEMLFRQGISEQVWIGANDIAEEGKFVWVHNNETAVELNKLWQDNEPNDYGRNEDCAVVFVNFEANDVPCDFEYKYFCMETPKKVSGEGKPFLSQQNIYIIAASGGAFLLLILVIVCIIICRRKGKRFQPLKSNHDYDAYPKERHDTVAYTAAGYAAFNDKTTADDKEFLQETEVSQYDYIGGDTPTEEDRRFYVDAATQKNTFHHTSPKEMK